MRLKRFAAPIQSGHSGQTGNTGRITGMAALFGLAALSACSGSASSEFSGDLFVRSCSIGCSDGSDGREVTCGVVNVTENQELSILFSLPVDPSSISPSSLQVTDTANGTSPEGLRFVDPLDPRRVIFRPSIAFENGGVSFSFETNRTYEILVPGVNQGDSGPFIRSNEGNSNSSRLRCSVETTEGIADIVAGNPIVEVFADRVTSFDANQMPLTVERVQIGQDASNPVTEISRFSQVFFEFNELMFLPTVADNGTGQSPFIKVRYDRDGSLATSGQDRFDLPGVYEFFVDQVSLTTSLVFTPEGTIPSAGTDPINPNLLVIRIPSGVTDAAGNPVTMASGGGLLVAVPEFIFFPEITLPENGETFDTNDLEDASGTGAVWANGILSPGISGGSGRLGELRVLAGETVTLNTESQDFPLEAISEIDVIGNGADANYPRTITVVDGVFEFSKIIIESSATLKIEGANPARLLSRGSCIVAPGAIIDASGESAVAHDSLIDLPSAGAVAPVAGPSGGVGGFGGDRAALGANTGLTGVGASSLLNSDRMGRPGEGVGGNGSVLGSGTGGAPFPAALPTVSTANPNALGGVGFNNVTDPLVPTDGIRCMVMILSAPGAGGGHARAGAAGTVQAIGDDFTEVPTALPAAAPNTPGGPGLGLEPGGVDSSGHSRRLLRWEENELLGGSGGGGGGNHPFGSRVAGLVFPGPVVNPIDCLDGSGTFQFSSFNRWRDHSGAGGGSGGGAVEITAGRTIDLEGRIDASGGEGGSPNGTVGADGSFAIPGGGGSGGAVRLRARNFEITGNGRIAVNGGAGGAAPWSANAMGVQARGGAGSAGLVRIESADPGSNFDFDFFASRLLPNEVVSGDPTEFLSFTQDGYTPANVVARRPDSMNGATSCWIRPVGSFVSLTFVDDSGPQDTAPGWNMDVVVDDGSGGGPTVVPFRGSPTSWEADFDNVIGYGVPPGAASPIVVRFQGARAEVGDLNNPALDVDPCDLDITDVQSPFVALGSVTPWVAHPADLNLVQTASGGDFTINMIRYCIIFDRTDDGADNPGQTLTSRGVLGVDNLSIRVQPE